MPPRYIVNAIPGLSRFLWRAELYKNFKLVKTASNNNLVEAKKAIIGIFNKNPRLF